MPLPAAAADTGSILGRLVSSGGAAVAGQVTATAVEGTVTRTVTAESDGSYAIDGLDAGQYTVRFQPDAGTAPGARFGYVDAWFPNARHPDDATRVTVNAGADTLFVDSALTGASLVSGRVGGAPGEYAVALVDRPAPEDPFDGVTFAAEAGPDGAFELRASAFDDYQLLVYRKTAGEWEPYYVDLDGEFGFEVGVAEDITVLSLENLPAPGTLDFILQLPDGSPAAGFEVSAHRSGPSVIARSGVTDADGRVRFAEVPPGTWGLTVNEADRVYPPLFLNGMLVVSGHTSDLTSSLAAPLPLDMTATPGDITGDLRLLLDRKGTRLQMSDDPFAGIEGVSWVLEDDDSGDARRGDFGYSPTDGWIADVPTDAVVGRGALGITVTYELGLTMLTIADVVVPELRDSASLTPETEGIIDAPARVEATQAFDVTGVRAGEWYEVVFFSDAVSAGWVQAEPSGVLRVAAPAGLTGEHRVALWTVDGDLLGWDALTVFATDTTPGGITGHLLAAAGGPVAGTATAENSNGDVYYARAGVTGDYALEVAPGEYVISFVPDDVSDAMIPWGYATGYWQDTTDRREADTVAVGAGGLVTGIDAALVPNGLVSGRVDGPDARYAVVLTRAGELAPGDGVDPLTAGLPAAEVGSDGAWQLPAAPGSYTATLYREFSHGWLAVAQWDEGSAIDVTERRETSGIDFTVPEFGGLVLDVRDPSGAPIADARAFLSSASGHWVRHATTDADGLARFEGVEVGMQRLAVRGGLPFSPLAIDGLDVALGEPEVLTVTLGDPLPKGFSVTGARTFQDLLLVDRGTVGLAVPAAPGVDALAYTALFDSGVASASVDLTDRPFQLADGTWSAGIDTTDAAGPGLVVIAIDEVGLTVRTAVTAVAPALLDPDALTDDARGALSAATSVAAGASVEVTGLVAGQWYSFGLTGSTAGAWVQASDSGAVSVPVAAASALGATRIALFDIEGSLAGWVAVEVVTASTPGGLAATGMQPLWGIGIAAVLLAGAGLVLRSRRRTVL